MPEADENGDVLMILSGVHHREGFQGSKDRHLCRRRHDRFSDTRPFPLASLLRLLKITRARWPRTYDRRVHAQQASSRMGGQKSQNKNTTFKGQKTTTK